MDISSLLIFAVALLLNAGSPGPSIVALVSRVLARGAGDVLPFVAAMWIGEIVWLTAAVLGLSALAATFHLGFVVLKYLGVTYLIYLSWKIWNQPIDSASELPKKSSAVAMFLSGLALTLGNPKIMVFYLALLPMFFDLTEVTVADWTIFSLVTLVVLAAIDLSYIALASRARFVLRASRIVRIVNRTSAAMMGGAAVAIATR